ncbi:MAG TPA: sialidase family protein, partial [Acidimicrobiales bacterium]|nr:sialidase family protein [Acidimicrobiales bacterium]
MLVIGFVAALAVGPVARPVGAQGAGSAQRASVRVTANYRLGADPASARGQDVPGLAVNPADPRHVVAVTVDALNGECEHHVSFDGGLTWRSGLLRAPAGFPEPDAGLPAPLCIAGSAMDGSIEFGSGLNVYTTFAARRSPVEGLSVLVARSTDGGRSYQPGVVAMAGGVGGPAWSNPELDVQPLPGGDRLYVGARRGSPAPPVVNVATSADGGLTWGPPVDASAPTPGAFFEESAPVVAPDGRVHIAWRNPGANGSIGVGTSVDGGTTWTRVAAARVSDVPAGTDASRPRMAVDPRTGTAYVVYMAGLGADDGRQDHFISANADILLIRSIDGGSTWSAPLRVNDDERGNLVSQRQARVAVASNGRVDVTWQDRRHGYRSPTNVHLGNGEARLGDTYYAFSTDGGVSFSPNRRISDRSTNNDVGIDYRAGTYQFFAPTLAPAGEDAVLFAWMDSREGDVDDDNQDIYLARLDHRVPGGPLPVRRVEAAGSSELSVALSRLGYAGGAEAVINVGFTSRPASRTVIVDSADPAAAMVGSVLARAHLASVIAAPGGALTAEQRAELGRIRPIGAFLLGDEDAVGRSVVHDVALAGVARDQITRVAPSTVAELASVVALSLDRRRDTQRAAGQPAFDAVVVANPAS